MSKCPHCKSPASPGPFSQVINYGYECGTRTVGINPGQSASCKRLATLTAENAKLQAQLIAWDNDESEADDA
tara:strand:+ start:1236 stop:1451 length:216 start_codon:yes stop_codon:yes gene_type:complete